MLLSTVKGRVVLRFSSVVANVTCMRRSAFSRLIAMHHVVRRLLLINCQRLSLSECTAIPLYFKTRLGQIPHFPRRIPTFEGGFSEQNFWVQFNYLSSSTTKSVFFSWFYQLKTNLKTCFRFAKRIFSAIEAAISEWFIILGELSSRNWMRIWSNSRKKILCDWAKSCQKPPETKSPYFLTNF